MRVATRDSSSEPEREKTEDLRARILRHGYGRWGADGVAGSVVAVLVKVLGGG
ncbi:hypothetical protein [Methanoculleus oceani]|uniref:hypothetical protein n=1 Tax=Methanoculleus oceani TaxID=2184756 RepID=UPI0020343E73|nr:hypothetical protein [Methanoculleus sp. CWC-02]